MNREIHLAARPAGEPRPADFALVSTDIPAPADGQIVVRNTWMSVDPYMRGRMDDRESYIPPFPLGGPMEGAALGVVVESRAGAVPVGATVTHFLGWREFAVLDAAGATVVDPGLAPAEAYLGALGATGLTAYATVTEVAPVRTGNVVFFSAAAGAAGSVAGQLARKLGATKVIGSAGGPEKAQLVRDRFGFDAAIDALRPHGHIALVGAISAYNATAPVPGPDNLFKLAARNGTLRGMLVSNYLGLFPEWIARGTAWLADGSPRTETTVVEGIERAPAAFLDLMRGVNVGKMLVRLSD